MLSPEEKRLEKQLAGLESKLLARLQVEKENLRKTYARDCGVIAFTEHTMSAFKTSWHHEIIGDALDELLFGNVNRLIIEMPPRHGKTELVSKRLVAYALGHFPEWQVIAASYNSELAEDTNRKLQVIMDSPEYRELFPDVRLPTDKDKGTVRTSTEFSIAGHKGFYRSVGIGGGLTGRGGNLGIIDDPYKDRQEADSPTFRERVWRWYQSTFYTRLENPNKVVIIHTRWHEDDLIGRLLEQQKSDPKADKWQVIRLPAIADGSLHVEDIRKPGEPLWPDGEYDLAKYEKLKAVIGSTEFEALFQQNPSRPGGNIIKKEYWRFYNDPDGRVRLPQENEFDEIIQSWDARFSSKADDGDFVVGDVWARQGSRKFLLEQFRGRWSFTECLAKIREVSRKYPKAHLKLVEKKANGEALENTLCSEISGIVLVEPKGDKVSRVNSIMPTLEAGNVYLPHKSVAPWIEDCIKEYSEFPKGTHDDRVDTLSQALKRFQNNESGIQKFRTLGQL